MGEQRGEGVRGGGHGDSGERQRKTREPLGQSEIPQRRVKALHKIGRKVKMV